MLIRGFNLARTDYRRARRRSRLACVGAVALALALAAQGASWLLLRREATATAGRLATMEAQVRQHEERRRAVGGERALDRLKSYEAKVTTYNAILEASAFSWTGLLFELERAVPGQVELREIQPDPASGKVTLAGVARSVETLSQLLRALGARPAFKDVSLVRQAEHRPDARAGGSAVEGVDFTLTLVYAGRP